MYCLAKRVSRSLRSTTSSFASELHKRNYALSQAHAQHRPVLQLPFHKQLSFSSTFHPTSSGSCSTMPPISYLLLALVCIPRAFSLNIPQPTTIQISSSFQFPSSDHQVANQTSLIAPKGDWECFRGTFSLLRRIRFGDCRTVILSQLPTWGEFIPVRSSYRTCTVDVRPAEGSHYEVSWRKVETEALELTAACKEKMRWNFFVGGQSRSRHINPLIIKLLYNTGYILAENASTITGTESS